MAIEKKSKKNTTSVNMTLRLDPRSKYLIDLLTRQQKRTITGVIEWAVERAGAETTFDNDRGISFLEVIDSLWSTDESVRLANLALARPDLLDYDELRIWETIKASPDLWNTSGQLLYSTLQEEWDSLLEHVEQHRLSRAVKPYFIL
ncbi:hypothetical protein [Aeromonas hydrophila]|uniref:hypothetical protein n=1 Tax=Aeromonas hydrophila TaxID=644 RepID=UPI000492F7E4|nr:hypothetical protein [Aeromonas hydrophila]QWL80231.1 hypothetical protein HQ395_16450 [Aeromonas hydrophila]